MTGETFFFVIKIKVTIGKPKKCVTVFTSLHLNKVCSRNGKNGGTGGGGGQMKPSFLYFRIKILILICIYPHDFISPPSRKSCSKYVK